MDKVASASLNTFGISPKADFVSPAESITIPASQLQAILEAIQGLQDEVSQLQATVASQGEEIAALRTKIASLESLQEQDVTRLACDIAQDRRRIAALESVEPQPMQRDRAEILRALLVANGGKLLAKVARNKMHMTKSAFSKLLAVCDFIERKPYHLDGRQDVIILKSELVARN